jgi:hypothetical protein
MHYEIRCLMMNEESVVIKLNNLTEADVLVPMLGNLFSEVKALQVVAIDDFGTKEYVLHMMNFITPPNS